MSTALWLVIAASSPCCCIVWNVCEACFSLAAWSQNAKQLLANSEIMVLLISWGKAIHHCGHYTTVAKGQEDVDICCAICLSFQNARARDQWSINWQPANYNPAQEIIRNLSSSALPKLAVWLRQRLHSERHRNRMNRNFDYRSSPDSHTAASEVFFKLLDRPASKTEIKTLSAIETIEASISISKRSFSKPRKAF